MADAWDELRKRLPPEAAEALVRELDARYAARTTGRLAMLVDLWQGVPRPQVRIAEVKGVNASILT